MPGLFLHHVRFDHSLDGFEGPFKRLSMLGVEEKGPRFVVKRELLVKKDAQILGDLGEGDEISLKDRNYLGQIGGLDRWYPKPRLLEVRRKSRDGCAGR